MADTPRKVLRGKTPLPVKLVIAPPKVDFQSGGVGSDLFLSVSGLEALAETLRSMPQVARDAAGFEMAEIAHEVIEDAKENYVPWDTRALLESGDADEYKSGSGAEITQIAMWFGSPLSEGAHLEISRAVARGDISGAPRDPSRYAEIQHEDMFFKHPRGGGPKYLEIPFNARIGTMVERIASAVGIAWSGNSVGGIINDKPITAPVDTSEK